MGCDVVVLDLRLEDGVCALDFIPMIKDMKNGAPIVIYTATPKDERGQESLEKGADMYVEKNMRPDELVRIIERLVRG